jgi:hypothetical protein
MMVRHLIPKIYSPATAVGIRAQMVMSIMRATEILPLIWGDILTIKLAESMGA